MICPECHGPQLAGHPAGQLAIQHRITCGLYEAESQTRAADRERWRTYVLPADAHPTTDGNAFERPATEAERILLAAFGHAIPDTLTTRVVLTGVGPNRTWPALATPN